MFGIYLGSVTRYYLYTGQTTRPYLVGAIVLFLIGILLCSIAGAARRRVQ